MNSKAKKLLSILLIFAVIFAACTGLSNNENTGANKQEVKEDLSGGSKADKSSQDKAEKTDKSKQTSSSGKLDKNSPYYSKDDVANYLIQYRQLPKNYLTKNEAMDKGWDAKEGNLWDVTDKGVIGGDKFGNREGLLPTAKGRKYYEADVNYKGGFRGSERLIYSNDGLIFYTNDHYSSFEEIRGGE